MLTSLPGASIHCTISMLFALWTVTEFRPTFKRLDDLPTNRNWDPMSTLRASLGTFKRLDDLPTYRSGSPLGVNWGPMPTLRAFLGTFKRLDDLPTYRSGGPLGIDWDALGSHWG